MLMFTVFYYGWPLSLLLSAVELVLVFYNAKMRKADRLCFVWSGCPEL